MRVTCAFRPKAVSTSDFNGDGRPDYIVDYSEIDCRGYCGSAGCTVTILVSKGSEYVRAYDDNLHSFSIKPINGRDALVLDLHGSACGKVGAAQCRRVIVWSGNKFVEQR